MSSVTRHDVGGNGRGNAVRAFDFFGVRRASPLSFSFRLLCDSQKRKQIESGDARRTPKKSKEPENLMRYLGPLTAFVVLLSPLTIQAEAPKAPNVLWICADDLAAYVCGAYGNTIVKTPNLDRLADGGMRFDRAYCNSPVCTASRQSFLTGQYPRTLGVTQLKTALPDSTLTLPKMLAGDAHRYDTAAIGKMHFNSNLKHGFDMRLD